MIRRSTWKGWMVVFVWVLGFLAAETQAGELAPGNEFLQHARILYDNAQYPEALKLLVEAIKVKGTTRKEVVEIYRLMGSIYIAQGNSNNAQKAFEMLLKVDSTFELNPLLTSPKILNFYNKVKGDLQKKDQVIMTHTPINDVSAAERIELKAYVVDLQKRMKQLRLYFKRRGEEKFSSVEMTMVKETGKGSGTGDYLGYVPFLWNVYGENEVFVEYYIVAMDRDARWLANAGSPRQSLGFRINLSAGEVPAWAKKPPMTKTWWFWSAVGTGAVGAGVGLYFLISSLIPQSPPPDGARIIFVPR